MLKGFATKSAQPFTSISAILGSRFIPLIRMTGRSALTVLILSDPTIRSLSMQSLEKGMGNTSLMSWFEAVLPPRSVVIWPDVLASCGEQQGSGVQASSTPCAEIHFNDAEGNSGTLYIVMTTGSESRPGEASFHASVYNAGDRSLSIGSLADLQKKLASSAK